MLGDEPCAVLWQLYFVARMGASGGGEIAEEKPCTFCGIFPRRSILIVLFSDFVCAVLLCSPSSLALSLSPP